MIQAIERPSPRLEFAVNQVGQAGDTIRDSIRQSPETIKISEKGDESLLTELDEIIHNTTTRNIGLEFDELTMGEESATLPPDLIKFKADYDDPEAWCLDSIDGTGNFVAALGRIIKAANLAKERNEKFDPIAKALSTATVSLAKLAFGQPAIGALDVPLLQGTRRTYGAEDGMGAFVQVEGEKRELRLPVGEDEDRGIILISDSKKRTILCRTP